MKNMSLRLEGRISVEIQTGYFLNTQYISAQHANIILQYVLVLQYIWAKNLS